MGIPKNPQKEEIPKMENCSAPKWGCKNPQLVDLPKSRYPIVHLTSLTEKRQCRCSLIAASCCAADTRRTTAFALHGAVRIPSHHAAQGSRTTRTHTHAHATPLVQTRPHADRRTTQRHRRAPFFILFSTAGGWGSLSQARTPRRRQAPSGGTRSGRDTVAGQGTVAMQRTVAMPDTVAAGAIRLSR